MSLKSKLEIVSKCLIDSFDTMIEQTIQAVLIDKKQNFYNMKEKLNFYKTKLDSFIIAIESSLLQEDPTSHLKQLSVVIIETFVSRGKLFSNHQWTWFQVLFFFKAIMFNDAIGTKHDIVNNCATFCQAVNFSFFFIHLIRLFGVI